MAHDYVDVALILIAIVGLALLPSPSSPVPGSDSGVELVGKANQEGEGIANEHGNGHDGGGSSSRLLPGVRDKSSDPSPHARPRVCEVSPTVVFIVNFGLWIILAMAFNAYSKAYVKATANPIGLVVLQGATGVLVLCPLGGLGVLNLNFGAELSAAAAWGICLSALCHAVQALMTNFAVFVGGVAITNALKAMEPVAAAVFSYFLLGKRVSSRQCGALVIIISGILLLTSKSKGGSSGDGNRTFLSAVFTLAAVCANALRNVVIKKANPIPPHQTLLACSLAATIFGCGLMFVKFIDNSMDDLQDTECDRSGGGDGGGWIRMEGVIAALCYVGFQFASFNLLAFLSPVGHAVGNSCKRVLVFGSGIVLLGEAITFRQLGGTAVALSGVLAYSLART